MKYWNNKGISLRDKTVLYKVIDRAEIWGIIWVINSHVLVVTKLFICAEYK